MNVWLASALRIDRKRDDEQEEYEKTDSFSSNSSVTKGQRNRRSSNLSTSLSKYWFGHSNRHLDSQDTGIATQHKVPTWSNIIDLESEFRPTLLTSPITPVKELNPKGAIKIDSNHIELRAMVKHNPYSGTSPGHGNSASQKLSPGFYNNSRIEVAPKERFQYSCVTETKEFGKFCLKASLKHTVRARLSFDHSRHLPR